MNSGRPCEFRDKHQVLGELPKFLVLVSRWLALALFVFRASSQTHLPPARVVSLAGQVSVQRRGATPWDPAYTNQTLNIGDHLRTAENSKTTLRLGANSEMSIGPLSLVEILPPRDVRAASHLKLTRGLFVPFTSRSAQRIGGGYSQRKRCHRGY